MFSQSGTGGDTEHECPTDAKRQKLDSDGSVTEETGRVNHDSDVDGVSKQTHTDDPELGPGGPEESTERISMETDVGITEYISALPGFSGVLKQRWSSTLT